MKKVLFTLGLVMTVLTLNAQGLRVGLAGGVNNTWFSNKNVSDQGDNLDFAVTFGGSFGVEALYNFNEKAGISLGILYSGHNQKYEGDQGADNIEQKTTTRYLDLPLLFRATSTGGSYFEIGPQFGFLMDAEDDGDVLDGSAKGGFNNTNIAAVLGFGVDIDASESVVVSIGLRLGYGFTDATKEFSENDDVPDDVGFTAFAAHFDDKGKLDYKQTNRIFGGLHIGVSYIIPSKSSPAAPSN